MLEVLVPFLFMKESEVEPTASDFFQDKSLIKALNGKKPAKPFFEDED